MASIKKLKVGQVLYTVSKSRAGNTMLRTVNVHEVKVEEIDPEGHYVIARWNYNRPEKYRAGDVSTWKISKPITVPSVFGTRRLATKEEKAEIQRREPQQSPATSTKEK